MSYLPAAEIRPKSFYVGHLDCVSPFLNSIPLKPCKYTQGEPSSIDHLISHTGQVYRDAGQYVNNTHIEYRPDAILDNIPSSFRPPYSPVNSNNPVRVTNYHTADPKPLTVRIPQGPRSCPPCSPVTRIVHSVSADGASSPGTKTVTFEVPTHVPDDNINLEVQAVIEKLEKRSKKYEDIPIIRLKEPPKGKKKRPLSSDSDSFSSDLHSSGASLNSSTTSESFQKLHKSPELITTSCSLSSIKSPKKLKPDSESSSSFTRAFTFNISCLEEDGKRMFPTNDSNCNYLKLPTCNYPQTPIKNAAAFCSTPLEFSGSKQPRTDPNNAQLSFYLETESKPSSTSTISRPELWQRASSSSVLNLSANEFQSLTKTISLPKLDAHNSRENTLASNTVERRNISSLNSPKIKNSRPTVKKVEEHIQGCHRKKVEPSVFIFPEVSKKKSEDEVDGFGYEQPMDMEVDSFDDQRSRHLVQQNSFQFPAPGSFQSHAPGHYSHDYSAYSAGQRQSQGQSFNYSNSSNYETPHFNASRFSSSNNVYHKEYNYIPQSQGVHGLYYGDDLDSGGTSQARSKKKDSEVIRTPKDNRTKVPSTFEDILDVGENSEDVQHVLNKFSDQEINQRNNAFTKQDLNNNSGHYFGDHRHLQSNVVSTKADMNVCFVSPSELPDSDMSCDDMDEWDNDRDWDETDGSRQRQVRKKSVRRAGKSSINKISGKRQVSGLPHGKIGSHPDQKPAGATDFNVSTSQRNLPNDYGNVVESQRRRSLPSNPPQLNEAHNSDTIPKSGRQSVYKEGRPSSNSNSLQGHNKSFPDKINQNNMSWLLSVDRTEATSSKEHILLSKCVDNAVNGKHSSSRHSYETLLKNDPQQHHESFRRDVGLVNQSQKYNNLKKYQPEVQTPMLKSTRHSDGYSVDIYNDDDSDGGDEVDGLGNGNEQQKKADDRSILSHSVPQKVVSDNHVDDIVHCFGSSDNEANDDNGQSDRNSPPVSQLKTNFSSLASNKHTQDQTSCDTVVNKQLSSDRPGGIFMSASGNFVAPEMMKELVPVINRQTHIRTTPVGAEITFIHPHAIISSSSPGSSNETRLLAGTQIKDDTSVSGFPGLDLKNHLARRSSDTFGQVTPDLIIPRSSSSPSKLENSTSGDKLRKGQQTFHRPWISPENKMSSSFLNFQTHVSGTVTTATIPDSGETTRSSSVLKNSSTAAVRSQNSDGMTLQGSKNHDGDPRSAQNVKSQAADASNATPDNLNIFKYSSTSDPNKYSNVLMTQSRESSGQRISGHQPDRSKRTSGVGTPAKRNRVDRRLNFESQVMDTNQKIGVSQISVIGNQFTETSENPNVASSAGLPAVPESSRTSKTDTGGAPDGRLEGATSSTLASQTLSGHEAGSQLKRVCDLMSLRGEAESSRQDNEIDVRIEVTDSLRLSERLEQIYQANDRSCECARIEQEILGKSIELFKELCDPNKRYDNWKVALRDTNNVIRDSLEVADAIRQVCCHGRTVIDVLHGSVILRLKCRTLMSVVDLCNMYSSGDLHRLLCTILCSQIRLNGFALKVSIDSINVQRCISFLSRAIQETKKINRTPQHKVSSERRCVQVMKHNVMSSPSTPTFRVSTQTRCSSSPALHTQSPLSTPTSASEKRHRTFSFGETRIALQELHLSDKDSPTSPLGATSRWNYSPNIVSSPFTPLRQVTSPHLRTSPLTSPLMSPRKPKRHDVIQEQENIGDASVHLTT